MGKLSIRTLERNNLPYGRYGYVVHIKRNTRSARRAESNAHLVEKLRSLLTTTCRGKSKLVWSTNFKGRRVYTHLYLTEPMDLALVKLVHGDQLNKIYRVRVPAAESA